MKAIHVSPYTPDQAAEWNSFVSASRNATFLHDRRFMDYHKDRFTDASLMVKRQGKLIAILPANIEGDTLNSHGGLTYGGILVGQSMRTTLMHETVDAILTHARAMGVAKLIYKPSPHFYHSAPVEEDLYAIFQEGGTLIQSDAAAAIPLRRRPPVSQSRRQAAKRATTYGLIVRESSDWAAYWALLEATLSEHHDTSPTHSRGEIELLAHRFPDQIKLWAAFHGDQIVSGVVVFDCGRTVHAQYMASSRVGKENGGLDLIILSLINTTFADRDWFDFGISTTERGRNLNSGLAQYKEMFGARCVLYERYQVDL